MTAVMPVSVPLRDKYIPTASSAFQSASSTAQTRGGVFPELVSLRAEIRDLFGRLPYIPQIQSDTDYRSEAKANFEGQINIAKSQLLDLTELPEDEKPTHESMSNGFSLIKILADCGLLAKLQIWPTNNCTIEFGERIDEDNQFILETSNGGISGFVRIFGDKFFIENDTSSDKLIRVLSKFAELR